MKANKIIGNQNSGLLADIQAKNATIMEKGQDIERLNAQLAELRQQHNPGPPPRRYHCQHLRVDIGELGNRITYVDERVDNIAEKMDTVSELTTELRHSISYLKQIVCDNTNAITNLQYPKDGNIPSNSRNCSTNNSYEQHPMNMGSVLVEYHAASNGAVSATGNSTPRFCASFNAIVFHSFDIAAVNISRTCNYNGLLYALHSQQCHLYLAGNGGSAVNSESEPDYNNVE